MTAAISYGTEIWLAELKQAGWNVTVSEKRAPLTFIAPQPPRFGVLATDEAGAGVFVPCPDKDSAWRLLERVDDEIAGVA